MSDRSKLEFEKHVINSNQILTDNTLRLDTNAKKPVKNGNKRVRIFLVVFTFFLLCSSLTIIIRQLFILNPPIFQNTPFFNLFNTVFTPQSTSELNDVRVTDITASSVSTVGDNVTGSFTPDYSDQNIIIRLTDHTTTNIGVIDQNGNFKKILSFPYLIDKLHLLSDRSLIFSLNQIEGNFPQLYFYQYGSLKPILLQTASGFGKFTDIYFETSQKLVYYNFIDNTGISHIQAVTLAGKVIDVYSTGSLYDDTLILNLDNSNNYIYLKSKGECTQLNIINKMLKSYTCEAIKINNSSAIFTSNTIGITNFPSQVQGQIYEYSTNDGNRKIILTGDPGEIYDNFTYHNNSLYFIAYKLVPNLNNSWSREADYIGSIDINTLLLTKITNKFPNQEIVKLIPTSNNMYVVINNQDNTQSILKYNILPVSYPLSYSNISNTYWTNLNLLQDFTSIILLEGIYLE